MKETLSKRNPEISPTDKGNFALGFIRGGLTAREWSLESLSPEGHAALWKGFRNIVPEFSGVLTLAEGVARVKTSSATRFVDYSDFGRRTSQPYNPTARDLALRISYFNAKSVNPDVDVTAQSYGSALSHVDSELQQAQGNSWYPMTPVTVDTVVYSMFKPGFLVAPKQ